MILAFSSLPLGFRKTRLSPLIEISSASPTIRSCAVSPPMGMGESNVGFVELLPGDSVLEPRRGLFAGLNRGLARDKANLVD